MNGPVRLAEEGGTTQCGELEQRKKFPSTPEKQHVTQHQVHVWNLRKIINYEIKVLWMYVRLERTIYNCLFTDKRSLSEKTELKDS